MHPTPAPIRDPSPIRVRRALATVPAAMVGAEPVETGRVGLRFDEPVETLVAETLAAVPEILLAVDRATAAGRWAVGFVAYDAAPAFDPALRAHRAPGVPLAVFALFDEAHVDDPATLPGDDFEVGPWTDHTDRADHERGVATVKDRIARGDTYQVNLTRRLSAPFRGDPLGWYRALERAQRGGHGVFLDLGDRALVSASPELFLRREALGDGRHRLVSKPMKGTRARGVDEADDRRRVADLRAGEKDRAENTMIVDLVRNDLGRLADIGTVTVPRLHAVETFPTVHQLVSEVEAVGSASLAETFAATFPAASITGAPKYATSRIITEVEPDARGVYCGAAGVVGPGGDAEFNVAIRTAWVADGRAVYGTGGGIVWDSDPAAEWEETITKTTVLRRAPRSFRLLETLRWEPGLGPMRLDRHLHRLGGSAEALGFDIDLDRVTDAVATVDADVVSRVRVLVGPHGDVEIEHAPLGPAPSRWTVPIDDRPTDGSGVFGRHKTTIRHHYDASRARFPDAPDVIRWNASGRLTETTIGNLVLDLDGGLVTPPVSAGLLAGTLRAELLELGKITEADLRLDDLERARAVFVVNALRGWIPVDVSRAGRRPSRIGP